MALGYITGRATSKLLNANVNIPLLFAASIISDIDLLIPGLQHRGPTHSLAIISMLFFPVFIIWRKKATPYFIALIQHPILGDYSTGRTQLFWPLTAHWYDMGAKITSLSNIIIEWIFFLTSMATILETRDARTLFQHHRSNLLLSIPIFTVLLPTLLGFPLSVPSELIIPHLTLLTIFTVSVLIDIRHIFKRNT